MVHGQERPGTPRRLADSFQLCLPALAAVMLFSCAASGLSDSDPRPPRRALQRAAPSWNNDWSRGAVFYEVFVRSFEDSNSDGIGDLKGLIAKLDYLNDGDPSTTDDLGVDALWLMPVFVSPSYHGYDTTDYEHINPEYGTDEDFSTLCREAHRRGIRVIVDLVVNHSGSGHPWFVDSSSSTTSAKRDWYVWRAQDPGWTQPWGGTNPTWHPLNGAYFYGVFWAGMPDLNIRNPEVRAEIKRLATLWLSRGADGFRLDAARHLVENGPGQMQVDQPETHVFWRELSAHVRSVKPQATLVGENWTDTPIIATYYGSTATVAGGDELPMNFDFPLASSVIQGVTAGSATGIAAKLAEIQATYPPGADDVPFLTNHDMFRVATQLGGSQGRLRNAAAILLTLPGTPFLYYGEEVGLENGGSGSDDRLKRTPMPWDASPTGGFTTGTPWFPFAPGRETVNVASQAHDSGSLLSRYRELIRVRHGSVALTRGDLELLTATTGNSAVLAFLRKGTNEQVLVVHNLGDSVAYAGPFAIGAGSLEKLLQDSPVSDPGGGPGAWRMTMPPRSTGIWRLR